MPPLVHGSEDVACIGHALELGDDGDDGGVRGDAVAEREDRVVGLFHALRDPPAASKTDDEEVHARAPTEFCEERSQGVVCVFWGRAPERAFAQPGGVP